MSNVSSRHVYKDDEQQPEEELSPFQMIERAVDLALQAHGIWNLEISQTMGEIVQVAEAIAKPTSDVRKGMFDLTKIAAADRDSVVRAIAIYMAVAAEMLGMTRHQMEKKLAKFAKELGDLE